MERFDSSNEVRPKFILKQNQDKDTAISQICKLAQYDGRYAKVPFYELFNEIMGCTVYNNYAIIVMPFNDSNGLLKETPVGYILWAKFNQITLALYAKGIRQLAVPEFNQGDDIWALQFCTPFGFQEELLQFVKSNLPQLWKDDKMLSLDLLERVPYSRADRDNKDS
jgi:hemolysin-activating ACP:hemolysin acyltransferase